MPVVSLSDVKVQVEEGNVRLSEDGGPIGQWIADRPIGPIWSTVSCPLRRLVGFWIVDMFLSAIQKPIRLY